MSPLGPLSPVAPVEPVKDGKTSIRSIMYINDNEQSNIASSHCAKILMTSLGLKCINNNNNNQPERKVINGVTGKERITLSSVKNKQSPNDGLYLAIYSVEK